MVNTEEGLVYSAHELPGYAFFLTPLFFLFGEEMGELILRLFQTLLSASGVFIIAFLTRDFFGRQAGIAAAVLWAIWLSEARLSGVFLRDAFAPIGILSASYFFFRSLQSPRSWKWAVWAGLTLGVLGYLRSQFLLLPLFWILVFFVFFRSAWKFYAFRAALAGGVMAALLLPWGLWTKEHTGRFTLTRPVIWQDLWEGFGEFENPFGAVRNDVATLEKIRQEYPNVAYTSFEYQDILKEKSLRALRDEPLWYAGMLPKRFLRMVFSHDIGWDFLPIKEWTSYYRGFKKQHPDGGLVGYVLYLSKEPPQLLYRIIVVAYWKILLALAVLGMVVARAQWRKIVLLASIPVYLIAVTLPIYWEPRFVMPGDFSFLIFAGVFLVWLYSRGWGVARRFVSSIFYTPVTKPGS